MKKVAHKILAVLMVTILLVSTTSFSLFKHFCGDNLVEISRYTQTDECCDKEIKYEQVSFLNFSKKDCCKSEIEFSPQLTFETAKTLKLAKNHVVFITSLYHSFIEKNEIFDIKTNFQNNSSPPKLVLNKQVQYQSFLI